MATIKTISGKVCKGVSNKTASVWFPEGSPVKFLRIRKEDFLFAPAAGAVVDVAVPREKDIETTRFNGKTYNFLNRAVVVKQRGVSGKVASIEEPAS